MKKRNDENVNRKDVHKKCICLVKIEREGERERARDINVCFELSFLWEKRTDKAQKRKRIN